MPAPHVHHTHPDGINVLAGAADERLVEECFGDSAAWVPYIRPGFTLSKQVGEAARANPDLKLVVLAKHGLVVWGDSAEEAYRRTIEVINQAVAFVNERTGDTERFGGRHAAADRTDAGLLHELLPAIRGAVSSERHKLLTVDHLAALARVRLLGRRRAARHRRRPAPTTWSTPSGCRCGSRMTLTQTTPTRCASGSPSAPGYSAPTTALTSTSSATTRPSPPTPTRGSC